MSEVVALESRVTRLENQITAGFEKIEGLLRSEISDLKSEQITDLREANKRLADDQRRLWERLSDLERRENMRIGSHRQISAIAHFVSAALGGLLTWALTWMTSGRVPPHP
jgi:hypothetical protein